MSPHVYLYLFVEGTMTYIFKFKSSETSAFIYVLISIPIFLSNATYICTYVVVDPVNTMYVKEILLHLHVCTLYQWELQLYVTGNLTGDDTTTPAYIRSTVTLRNVTVLDNGTVYRCGIGLSLSNGSTLTVVGKLLSLCIFWRVIFGDRKVHSLLTTKV